VRRISGDAEHQHEAYIRHINEALANRPAGMSVTTHMCRGNFRSSWVAQDGYDFVADALFNGLDVDGFFMEWDDARSGGFEPLRPDPKGRVVVLGLVTTKRGELEDRHALKRRIEEESRYVDLDQLCLSPQCGFSSTDEGKRAQPRAAGRQAPADRPAGRGGVGIAVRHDARLLTSPHDSPLHPAARRRRRVGQHARRAT
jgi:methionine synthase II (cobalamin-independent)